MLALQHLLARDQTNWEQRALAPFPVTADVDALRTGDYRAARATEANTLTFTNTPAGQLPRVTEGGVDLTYVAHGTHPHKPAKDLNVGRSLPVSQSVPRYTNYTEGLRVRLAAPSIAAGAGAPSTETQAMYEHVRALLPGMGLAGGAPAPVQAAMRQALESRVHVDVYALRAAIAYVAAVWAAQAGAELTIRPGVGVTRGGITTIEEYRAVWAVAARAQHVGAMMCTSGGTDASRTADIFTTLLSDTCTLDAAGLPLAGVAAALPPTGFDLLLALGAAPAARRELQCTPSELWAFGCDLCGQYGAATRFTTFVSSVTVLWWSSAPHLSPVFQSASWSVPAPQGRGAASLLLPGSQQVDTWLAGFPQPVQPNKKDLLTVGAATSVALGCAVREAFVSLGGWFLADPDVIHGTAALDACRTAGGSNEIMCLAESVLRQLGATGSLGAVLCGIAPILTAPVAVEWLGLGNSYQWEEAALQLASLPARSVLLGAMRPLQLDSQGVRSHWVDPGLAVRGDRSRVAKAAAMAARGARLGFSVLRYGTGAQEIMELEAAAITSYRGVVSDWVLLETRISGSSRVALVARFDSAETVLRCGMASAGTISRTWYIDRPAVADEYNDDVVDARAPPPEVPPPEELEAYYGDVLPDADADELRAVAAFNVLEAAEGAQPPAFIAQQPRFYGGGAVGHRQVQPLPPQQPPIAAVARHLAAAEAFRPPSGVSPPSYVASSSSTVPPRNPTPQHGARSAPIELPAAQPPATPDPRSARLAHLIDVDGWQPDYAERIEAEEVEAAALERAQEVTAAPQPPATRTFAQAVGGGGRALPRPPQPRATAAPTGPPAAAPAAALAPPPVDAPDGQISETTMSVHELE